MITTEIYVSHHLDFIREMLSHHLSNDFDVKCYNENSLDELSMKDIVIADTYPSQQVRIDGPQIIVLSKGHTDNDLPPYTIIRTPVHPHKLIHAINDISMHVPYSTKHDIILTLPNNYVIYINKQMVIDKDKQQIMLTDKECEIIILLYKVGKQGASKIELLNKIWGYKDDLKTSTIATHIYRLRNKIGDNDNDIIQLQNGIYRLVIA